MDLYLKVRIPSTRSNWQYSNNARTYVNTNTASTTPTTRQSYHDIEKGMPSIRIDDDQNSHPEEKSWFRSFFHRPAPSKSSNHERHPSHLSLSGQNTVSTNAWAGMSRSRGSDEFSPSPSRRDFIRVRQEISQESVMQEVVWGVSLGWFAIRYRYPGVVGFAWYFLLNSLFRLA